MAHENLQHAARKPCGCSMKRMNLVHMESFLEFRHVFRVSSTIQGNATSHTCRKHILLEIRTSHQPVFNASCGKC